MRLTTYAYPWDLARLGVDRTLGEIAAYGFDAIDLAATYHPIDALSPRGDSVRSFSSARGAVHFPARAERYGRIRPSTSAPEVCAAWPRVAATASGLGLDVNAWTITLFQPWILDSHPECARVLPGGGASGSGVCPANDDVREYVATLCADMAEQFSLHTIRLEAPITQAYDFDWLRPRVLVGVSPLAASLLALCRCPACSRRAVDAGLDHPRLQQLADDAIRAELQEGVAGNADRATTLAGDAELRALAAQQARAATELVRGVIEHVRAAMGPTAPRFATSLSTPFGPLLDTTEDALLTELAAEVDTVTVMPGPGRANDRVARLAGIATPAPAIDMLLAPAHARTRPGEQEPASFREAVELDVSELGLYNYGLLRDRDVRMFTDAFRACFG